MSEERTLYGTHSPTSVSLCAARDVGVEAGGFLSRSDFPWLRIDFAGPAPAGRWIELTYAASLFDELVRPVLRCIMGERHHDEILPGPLFGRGIWLGLIPEGTKEIWVSPTNRKGPFGFSIERFTTLSAAEVTWRCLRRNPGRCLTGLAAHFVGLHYAANTEFRRVLAATRLDRYSAWRNLRVRPLDLAGIDSPKCQWQCAAHVRFVTTICADGSEPSELVAQLIGQPYPHWTLAVVLPPGVNKHASKTAAFSNEHIIPLESNATGVAVARDLSDDDLIAPIRIGDRLPAYAVAALAEAAARNPETEIFYGDEDIVAADGRYEAPILHPDWSPIFAAAASYSGDAEYYRVKTLKRFEDGTTALDVATTSGLATDVAVRRHLLVGHIRRVMRSRLGAAPRPDFARATACSKHSLSSQGSVGKPGATIIIPTRDRVELLAKCVESVKQKSSVADLEIIIVDNGSVRKKTRHFLSDLARDAGVRVLFRPGPFNFSKLCNDAAAEAKAPVLIFLNDDTEIIQQRWLEPLLNWARQSDVGAVGARLLYPNGRLQHAGVVLGIDGRAGHFERASKRDGEGFFGRLCVAHEVSSVTAACLAVEKRKFNAVGGFDAVNLPIELNDIDLCLRLTERGWKSICAAECVLIHHESASRGRTFRPNEVYRREHEYFRSRWMHRLRDDAYFHPALSLDRLDAALG